MAALVLAKAEHATARVRLNPNEMTVTLGVALRDQGRAREALMTVLMESLMAAGAKGELRSLETPA